MNLPHMKKTASLPYEVNAVTTVTENNPLNPIKLDKMDTNCTLLSAIIFQNQPLDIDFTHKYIQSEIERFNLTTENCLTCSPLIKHFSSPSALMTHWLRSK